MKRTAQISFLVLIAASLGAWAFFHPRAGSKKAPEAGRGAGEAPVTVATVVSKFLPMERRAFGVVEPAATVTVKSQITGLLTNVLFEEGQDVRQGDLLFVIDPRGVEAELKQAEANLARNTAQLRHAEKELHRQEELLKKGVTSEGTRDQARTEVEVLQAQVQADQASVENAALQVEHCFIHAPMDGRTGSLLVHRGNLVKGDDSALVTLNQIKPILVRCSFPQQDLAFIRDNMAEGPLHVVAEIPRAASRMVTGTVSFVANAVDSDTGTIQIKARFDNRDTELWPGQLVSVRLQVDSRTMGLVVPARAVMPGQNGAYVYVVADDRTVSNRAVEVERTVGDEAVISKGVAAGERVVTDGQLRLAPGVRVAIQAEPPSVPTGRP